MIVKINHEMRALFSRAVHKQQCSLRASSETSLPRLKLSSFLPAVFRIIELDYAIAIAGVLLGFRE